MTTNEDSPPEVLDGDRYASAWLERDRVRGAMALLLVGVVPVAALSYLVFGAGALTATILVAWIGAMVVAQIWYFAWPCPRCGEVFVTSRRKHLLPESNWSLLTRERCGSCGLRQP
jgi:hypothetical protein